MTANGNNNISPLNPGYENLNPTFYTGFSNAHEGSPGEAASDYLARASSTTYPTSTLTSSDWPVLDTFSPISSAPYFSAGDSMSSVLTLDTDSESDPFSPVEGLTSLDSLMDQWSWTQPSSPSLGFDSAPSSYQPPLATTMRPSKSTKSKPPTKLRTASRKPRKSAKSSHSASSPSEAGDDAITPEELRARKNHNLVEKQYRNRLNAQFERLLAVLPTNQRGGQGVGEEDKRMSKAEVLDVATRRIKELELDRRRLQKERRDLLQNMEMMTGVVGGAPRR